MPTYRTKMKNKTNQREECEVINLDNKRFCVNNAEYMCMCCAAKVCSEHKEKECPYGGMGYIDL